LDRGNDQQNLRKKIFVGNENGNIAQKPEIGPKDHHPYEEQALQGDKNHSPDWNILIKDL
jgi:hypothetical protein